MSNKKSQLKQFLWIFVCLGLLAAVSLSWVIKAQAVTTFDDVFNADDVKLVNLSESSLLRGYTPVCDRIGENLSFCHLTLRAKSKISINLGEDSFAYEFKTIKGSPSVRAAGYDIFDGGNWVKLESVDAVAGETFYIDLWAEIEGEDWQIDAVPCLFGDCESLSHFAIWTSYESNSNVWHGGTNPNLYIEDTGQVFNVTGSPGTFTLNNVSMFMNVTNMDPATPRTIEVWITSVSSASYAIPNWSIQTGNGILANCTPVTEANFVCATMNTSNSTEAGCWVETQCPGFVGQKGTQYYLDFHPINRDNLSGVQWLAADMTGTYPGGHGIVNASSVGGWYPASEENRDYYFRIDDTWGSGNTPPNFEPIADFSLNANFGSFEINLSDNVSDAETPDASLTYNWSMNDTGIVGMDIDNATGNMSFTSIPNMFGSVDITVTVNDGGTENNTNYTSFVLTVEEPCKEISTGQSITSSLELDPQCQYNVSGITIDSDDVTLNCNGAVISAVDDGNETLTIKNKNATITNCNIYANQIYNIINVGGNETKLLNNYIVNVNNSGLPDVCGGSPCPMVDTACLDSACYNSYFENNTFESQISPPTYWGQQILLRDINAVFYNNIFNNVSVSTTNGPSPYTFTDYLSMNITKNIFNDYSTINLNVFPYEDTELYLEVEDNDFNIEGNHLSAIALGTNTNVTLNNSFFRNNRFYNVGNQTYADGATSFGLYQAVVVRFSSNISVYDNYFENISWLGLELADVDNSFVYNNSGKRLYSLVNTRDRTDSSLDCHHNTIYDNALDNSEDSYYYGCTGIELRGSHHEHVYNNTIQGCNFGIRLRLGDPAGSYAHDNTIEDNVLFGFKAPGNCSASDSCDNFWDDGDVAGIMIRDGGHDSNIIRNNSIDLAYASVTAAMHAGIFLNTTTPIQHTQIESNTIKHVGNWSLPEDDEAWNKTYTGTEIHNIGFGILCFGPGGCTNTTITLNAIEETTATGIMLDGTSDSLVTGNTLTNTRGIEAGALFSSLYTPAASANNNISFNTLLGQSPVGSAAISLFYDTSSVIEHNTIDNGTRGIIFMGANSSKAEQNTISNLTWNPRTWWVTDATLGSATSLLMTNGTDMAMEQNDVYHNEDYAFYMDSSVLYTNVSLSCRC